MEMEFFKHSFTKGCTEIWFFILRQYAINKGRSRDIAWYSIINSEWNSIQETFEKWLDSKNFDKNGKQKISLSSLTKPL